MANSFLTHSVVRYIGTRRALSSVFSCAIAAIVGIGLISAGVPSASAQTMGIEPTSPGSALAPDHAPLVPPIGVGDDLHVSVVGQPDLTTDYQVDADGDITMLYVNKVHVLGMSPDEATNVIRNKLGTIYVDPEVTVTRAAMGGSSITVTGSVTHQGTETVRRDATLNDVIQMATPETDSDLTKVQITRGFPGQPHQTLTIDVADFLNSGNQQNNPTLDDGDVIFVPSKTAITYSVGCTGAVAKGGRFYVNPGTTVVDVIAQAGGLDDDADKANIYVQPLGTNDHRSVDYTKATQSPADPTINPVLSDGDEVVVSELQIKPVYTLTGGVGKPGQFEIDGTMTLSDAIGVAGGLQPRAQTAHTTIDRLGSDGKRQIIALDARQVSAQASFYIQPGDNIVIPPGSSQNQSVLNQLPIIGTILDILRL